MTSPPRAIAAALVLSLATPVTAQTASPTVPPLDNYSLPAARLTAVPIPPAPVIVLPTPIPVPVATAIPTPTATPTARPTPRVATVRPEPTATPEVKPTPTPTANTAPTMLPTPVSTPTPLPAPTAAPIAASAGQGSGLLWWIAAALAAMAAAAFVLYRRRRRDAPDAVDSPDAVNAPAMYSPTPPRTQRAVIGLSLRPIRAGLNMLSATVEAELTVVNTGDAPATDIRLALALFGARAGQEAELADHHAQPVLRPAVPPFALAPGETRTARVVVALPRAQITPMTAANRPMFVPIVAANCVYDTAGMAAQTAQSFAIGIERVDSAKLAPFWLDIPARMQDQVAARPHTPALIR